MRKKNCTKFIKNCQNAKNGQKPRFSRGTGSKSKTVVKYEFEKENKVVEASTSYNTPGRPISYVIWGHAGLRVVCCRVFHSLDYSSSMQG